MDRPNVILIVTDQQRADHLGCYANPVVATPSIDGLAVKGVAHDNCFVATPICMPNRASLMTMRMPSLHGVRHNGIPLSMGAPTFPELLAAAGYRTALIGKSHLQNMEDKPPVLSRRLPPGAKPMPGLDEARREDLTAARYRQESPKAWHNPDHRIATPFYGFDHVELCDEHGDRCYGDYGRWLSRSAPEADARRGPDGALQAEGIVAPQAWPTSLPEETYPTSWVGARCAAYLQDHANRQADQPFFLMCSFPDPHHPFTPPGRYWNMYDPHAIDLPASFYRPEESMPPPLAWLHAERRAGKAPRNKHRVFSVTEDEARQAIALTYGMITMIDDAVGRLLASLESTGMAENTVVIFTSDHGDFMGDHGLLLKGPLHYRPLIRVPLIWHDPTQPGGFRNSELASTLDIGTTILRRCGLAPPNGCQGMVLPGALPGAFCATDEPPREALIIEDENQRAFLGFERPVRLRTLIAGNWRLSLYLEGDRGEMYDLASDPHEMHNLWDEPAHAKRRSELLRLMVQVMMENTERSPLPTGLA